MGKVIQRELRKRLKSDYSAKWYIHKPEPVLEKETHIILLDFEIQKDYLILTRRPDQVLINKNKRTFHLLDFAVLADHMVKMKEIKKRDKYLVLAWDLKEKLWNMRVTVMPIVAGAPGTVLEGLERGLEELQIRGRSKLSRLQNCLDRPKFWEKLRKPEKLCCHLDSSERPPANTSEKKS